jgi:hypothetical protein
VSITARFHTSLSLLAAVAACDVANAHNLFILLTPGADGPDSINVIFEHSPYPGKGVYNQPFLSRGNTWIDQGSEDKVVSLGLKEVTRLGKKFLHTTTETQRPRAIIHSCKFGVYNGRLDYFYGKYLDVQSAEQLKQLGRTPKLPLDICPKVDSRSLKISVFFKDRPLAETKVWCWGPDGKERQRTTDASGVITLKNVAPGTHSFATVHVLNDPSGQFEGEPYKGVMHGTTCTLRWPIQ